MSLATQVSDLATRIATECKSIRTLLNGNAADNSALTTTAKGNLVLAINEVKAVADSALGGGWSPVDATETVKGIAEVATQAEVTTGTDDSRIVTPLKLATRLSGLSGADASETVKGIAELATQAEVNTGTDDLRIVTPLKFQTRLAAYAQPLDTDLTNIAALTTTAYGRGLLTTVDQAALTAALALASATLPGIVELATSAEVITGTDTTRAITPAGGAAAYQPLDSDLTAIAALTTTAYGRAFLALADQTALMALVQAASVTVAGKVELATDAETTTGTDTVRATTPANVAAAITARIDTNTALGSSNTVAPSQLAVKTYADALIGANDAMVFKGVIDASTNPNYPASNRGDTYRISVAGKIGGASGPNVEIGDTIMALTDGTASGTHATVGAQWNILQGNIDGAVVGPASAANLAIAVFSGTSGKLIADSGFTTDTDGTLAANSATRLPSQSAVKTYADTKQPLDADLTAIAALASTADRVPYSTGAQTWALATFTSAGRTLVGAADAAAQRTALSVFSQAEIGSITTDFVATFNAGLV